MGIENIEFYKKYLVAGAKFYKNDGNIEAIALYSNCAYHSLPISINLVMNSLVKFYLGDSYSVSVSNSPFPTNIILKERDEHVSAIEVGIFFLMLIPLGNFCHFFYIKLCYLINYFIRFLDIAGKFYNVSTY